MKEYLKSRFNKENKGKIIAGIVLTFVVSFMLCFYAPFELFCNNLDEFSFDTSVLLPVLIRNTLVYFAVSFAVFTLFFLISDRIYGIFMTLYFVIFILLYIQGNFMSKNLPTLDGTPVDWSGFGFDNFKTILALVIISAVVALIIKFAKMKKFYGFINFVTLILFAILVFTSFVVYFQKGAYSKDETNICVDKNDMLEMSTDKNFVIFLTDCVDARALSEVFKEHPEYEDIFADFTYYTNAMSTYPYTSQSIPYILTGKWYKNEQSFLDYNNIAYKDSPLFKLLEKKGYSIGLYDAEIPDVNCIDRFENIYDTGNATLDKKKLGSLEVKAALYTYTPYFMKSLFEYDGNDFKKLKNEQREHRVFTDVDYNFYQDLLNDSITKKEQKAFKFIHIEGAHAPFRYNKDVELVDDATYATNIEASLTIVNKYISMLKEADVYDNSVIIVMSDHGYEGSKGLGIDRQNPALFIKGYEEKHGAMSRNDAPISYVDLQEAFKRLLDDKEAAEVFDYKEGDEREREYIIYALNDKDHMFAYTTKGHASDTDALVKTGETFVREEGSSLGAAIAEPFKKMIKWIYDKTGSMFWAIVLFTLFTKIILLPISIWVQFNSIKMVKMQPEINKINAKYYGDKETISEKKSELFKREKYNPLVSIIPMVIQLLLLMIVIDAIKGAMTMEAGINTYWINLDLRIIPSVKKGVTLLAPVVAALSAWVMCFTQNKSNVLQSEQGGFGKYGAMILSVLLSLYLGIFVMIGVVVYWVASNLMSVAQMYILNFFINPKKYVDYEALEESKKQFGELKNIGNNKKSKEYKKYAKKEKEDYKRFFSVVNKHLVFYSENSGFYKYYKGMIEYLLEHTNLNIHYITSDPEDAIFELAEKQEKIKPYYIAEKKLITLFMKMEADVVVMTMPDLENFHIKRSYVKNDIEYIFIPHSMDSLNMTMRTSCMDHYDTVLCVGPHQKEEIEKNEIAYNTTKKKLIDWGYSLLDEMIEDYNNTNHEKHEVKTIMIAPSWQEDNIVDSCLEEILDELKEDKYNVIVRPHPQHVRHRKEYMEVLKQKYADNDNITIQTDFSSNSDVFNADLLITDWSGISYEYAYATRKPVLHINTPMKIMNPEYQTIDTVPINILVREEIGCSVDTDKLNTLREKVNDLINRSDEYYEKIGKFIDEYVYNLGKSGEVGARYIYSAVEEKVNKRKAENAASKKANKDNNEK